MNAAEEPPDVARLRKAFAALERRDPDEAGEPVDPGRIFDAVQGELGTAERQAMVERLLIDPDAAEAWRLARDLAPDQAGHERDVPAIAAEPQRPAWAWVALAAALVLAAGLGWQRWQRPADEPVYRSVEPRTISSALAPDAELSRVQPTLRWTAVPGARYRVRVLTADLQPLDESPETDTAEYTIPAPALARVPPGGRILWQVDARVPGEGIVTSPTFSNRVP